MKTKVYECKRFDRVRHAAVKGYCFIKIFVTESLMHGESERLLRLTPADGLLKTSMGGENSHEEEYSE